LILSINCISLSTQNLRQPEKYKRYTQKRFL
jgi:hypothetical protein